jgi:hypothetical protein
MDMCTGKQTARRQKWSHDENSTAIIARQTYYTGVRRKHREDVFVFVMETILALPLSMMIAIVSL